MASRDRMTPDGIKLFKELEKLTELEVRIGYQAGQAVSDEGVDMCDIAMWNELGTVNTPSRPFLRQSVEGDNGTRAAAFMENQLGLVLQGGTAEDFYKRLGVFQKAQVQRTITSGQFVGNAPSTIKKKGSSRPLVDTSRMLQSVNYVVKKKGG